MFLGTLAALEVFVCVLLRPVYLRQAVLPNLNLPFVILTMILSDAIARSHDSG